MPLLIDRTILPVLSEAQNRLGLTQDQLGDLAGVSRRTVLRWYTNRATPSSIHVTPIISALHPQHRDVATKLAQHLGTTLAALGLVVPENPKSAPPPPAPPPPPPVRPLPPTHLLVDSIVCAAAEALGTTPTAVRPVVQAAFARARGLGVTVHEVDDALSGKPPETRIEKVPAKSAGSSRKNK